MRKTLHAKQHHFVYALSHQIELHSIDTITYTCTYIEVDIKWLRQYHLQYIVNTFTDLSFN